MRRSLFFCLVLAGLCFSYPIQATVVCPNPSGNTCTLYVSPSGTGSDCTTLSPCSLQDALTYSELNGKDNTINLAAGTYTPLDQFTYASATSGQSLTLIGSGQDKNNENTFIVTAANENAMVLNSQGPISVSKISFGTSDSGSLGAGLYITDLIGGFNFNIDIQDCAFLKNGGGLKIDNINSAGSLNLQNNLFDSNVNNNSGAGILINSVQTFPLTLTNNTFTNNSANAGSGGAIQALLYAANSPVVMTNNTFTGNTAGGGETVGGAIYVYTGAANSPITITKGSASGNSAKDGVSGPFYDGGAFYLKTQGTNSPITVGGAEQDGVVFTSNQGAVGGALYIDTDNTGASVTVSHNIFGGENPPDGNTGSYGGAIRMYAGYGLTFENNLIQNNIATAGKGGVLIDFDGDYDNTFSSTISHNTISNNSATAESVGGMAMVLNCDCGLTLNANLISGNTASVSNIGGLWIDYASGSPSPLTMTNNMIVNNSVQGVGGGLEIAIDASVNASLVTNFINNTIANNSGNGGSGLFITVDASDIPVFNIYNNIFWGNMGGVGNDVFAAVGDYSGFSVNNNDVDDEGFCLSVSSGPPCNGGAVFQNVIDNGGDAANNISADPLFVGFGSGADSYLLLPNSPALGVGDGSAPALPSSDFDGQAMLTPPTLGALQNPARPTVSVDPSSKDYGHVDVGSSSSQLFTVTNSGTDMLTTSSLVLSDTTNFTLNTQPSGTNPPSPCGSEGAPPDVHLCDVTPLIAHACGDTPLLQPGHSCVIEIIFNPTVAENISANLLITSNASNSPTSVALTGSAGSGGCVPVLGVNITAPLGSVNVGDNVTFGITMTNSASCDSENTTLNLQFSNNMEFVSGASAETSSNMKFLKNLRLSGSGITCSGSGTSATCNVGTLAANSSLSLNITNKVMGEGTLTVTANLSNQAGTATASAIATATGVNPSSINGGGCALSRTEVGDLRTLWIYMMMFVLLFMRREKVRGRS